MGWAEERMREILTGSDDFDLGRYLYERRMIEEAIKAEVEPPSGKIEQLNKSPLGIEGELDPKNPGTITALATAAVAYLGYPWRDSRSRKIGFGKIWKNTRLAKPAEEAEEIANGIRPYTQVGAVQCSLEEMSRRFEQKIFNGTNETIVVTGMNGAGKTTCINGLQKFLELCRVKTNMLKFPRYNDPPLGPLIKEVLAGESSMTPEAFQLIVTADALNHIPDEGIGLTIFDRHPIRDALVYGPKIMVPGILGLGEMEQSAMWTFIIDRHPMAANISLGERGVKRRMFEKQYEQLVEKWIRFAALVHLPGVRWVNNDIGESDGGINTVINRFLGTVVISGVLDRAMVRQGISPDLNAARDRQLEVFIRNFTRD